MKQNEYNENLDSNLFKRDCLLQALFFYRTLTPNLTPIKNTS